MARGQWTQHGTSEFSAPIATTVTTIASSVAPGRTVRTVRSSPHILERRYEMSQAPLPGQPITNLKVPPNLSPTGNYALCAKCHDLNNVMSNSSFREHARHISDGFSCSVCHTAHGMGSQSATLSGERMVNFDTNVVAPNGRSPIFYRRATDSCSLTCHGHAHNAPGAVPTGIGGPIRTQPN